LVTVKRSVGLNYPLHQYSPHSSGSLIDHGTPGSKQGMRPTSHDGCLGREMTLPSHINLSPHAGCHSPFRSSNAFDPLSKKALKPKHKRFRD
jgi:hypothetical protein